MFKLKNKTREEDNFLLYVPVKNHENWIEKEDKIYLVFEHNKPIDRFTAWLVKRPTVTDIKLDGLGSPVWKLIDGNSSIYDIGQVLLRDFGSECEPVYDRLTMYIHYLFRKGWVRFKQNESQENTSASR